MNYATAKELLKNRDGKKLENNTYLSKGEENIYIRLHDTNIITFLPNGRTILNSGGYKTATTKDRMNKYLPHPFQIYREQNEWYLYGKTSVSFWNDPNKFRNPFKDGMVITKNGRILKASSQKTIDRNKKLKIKIKEYVKLYTKKLPIPKPSTSDCLYCALKLDHDPDHIDWHIKEKYIVPSLAYNALLDSNCGPLFFEIMFNEKATDLQDSYFIHTIEKALYKYIAKRKGFVI